MTNSEKSRLVRAVALVSFAAASEHLLSRLKDEDAPVVCVEHARFIPCRSCMYSAPARTPYSQDPSDVQQVQAHQAS